MSILCEVDARSLPRVLGLAALLLIFPSVAISQTPVQPTAKTPEAEQTQAAESSNRELERTQAAKQELASGLAANEYRIGPNDLVEIHIFEASELNSKLRVSASGEITMPLLGTVQAGNLTAHDLEGVLESRLREYIKDPHVGVFVSAMESHPVSVLGAVKKPGVFQVRGPKSVLEMLSMAEGLADDAGDAVLVMRGAGADAGTNSELASGAPSEDGLQKTDQHPPAPQTNTSLNPSAHEQTIRINLKELLQSEDPRLNVAVYPGDILKVVRAGVVYVVGEVKKPGGFILKNNERMSVLKAIALAEGLTPTSAKGAARIIKSEQGGQREEIPINLGKILAGKQPDPTLSSADIVFVPNSAGKTATYKGSQAVISALVSLMIFRW